MSNERRKAVRDRRVSPRIPATFAVRQSSGGRIQMGQAEEIGPGGLTMRRPRDGAHPLRTEVTLRFQLPGTHEEIDANGVVTHDSGAGTFRRTGLAFIALRSEHQQANAAFCRRVAQDRAERRPASASGRR
jgi:hypothetical protein